MRVATILPLAGAKVYTAHLFEQLPDCGEQPFRGDGEIAHADTRGVVDGIRHRRRDARRTQLTDPLGPQGAGVPIDLVDEVRLELPDVRVHRHEVAGEVL